MKRFTLTLCLCAALLASCAPVDLNAPIPTFETGIDPNTWAQIPAGEFHHGQFDETASTEAYEIMVTDVTAAQYADFLNAALADGSIKMDGGKIVGFYPGDTFHGVKHEEKIEAGDWLFIPLDDPSQRIQFDGTTFTVQSGYEKHPMTSVTWFGAWGYCQYFGTRLPTELEWEKAARGTDERPFPWGDEIQRGHANFYSSRDPFEDMASFGSRTSPVGFYNGQVYDGFQTIDSASPYGLYDMAGNVWQWTGDVYEGMHYRFMRGGSKDTYDMDLRIWVRNNATPTYFSPGVGFRCARDE
ncbi:MAG TPA: SUMF1/EgtB/PvdO family nonheme iron enzyme [Anaerolineales bacterium]|nr:SUMF1/EgtB/PvdO family nonheme iron enzyme [Anaerolineales bacterium]HMZ42261.1 SUMF1/EgtB/PvdO family nonheme iron enzyme [Anaerolineales bacterium]HNA55547.1 SUMF1/EgtB/PvdO family nonheme iron enzyme [Anaerolineales bacterium]HNB86651.1 SUMF1/EgtB/PvdO family nonheme iron enzyme [Anaerolineales bacterium]HNC87909.1 SUMF1/EgtB/PvdO family nonheme iron enzyme [Anaerolineales bacterium]